MSNLLSQASLVMIPSGYKEDVVYSQIPLDGSGDMSFTRASNGTRINSQGLVEVCPWNLLEYSEQFNNGYWGKDGGVSVSANTTTAPNGTTTAETISYNGTPNISLYKSAIAGLSGAYTISFYIKAPSGQENKTINFRMFSSQVNQNITLTNEWVRYEFTTTAGANNDFEWGVKSSATATSIYLYGAQLNIGSTAKPYFPTTDRLNVPRLTYQNGGGGCPSLLLEKQSTNLALYSEEFDNAYWNKLEVTITANTTNSPSGILNADSLIESTSNGRHMLWKAFTSVIGTSYTLSVFCKQNTRRYANINFKTTTTASPRFSALFDLQTGTNVSTSSVGSPTGTSFSIVPCGNGWYRISITMIATSISTEFEISASSTSTPTLSEGSPSYLGDGTSGIYLYGAQLEASSYPTSYIPTTSSSATRVADACFKTGISSLIGQTSGTMFVDFEITNAGGNQAMIITSAAGNEVNRLQIYLNSSLQVGAYRGDASVNFVSGAYSVGQRIKAAVRYKLNDYAFYVNGVQIGTDTSASIPPTPSVVYLGTYVDQVISNSIKINQSAIFAELTNAELASLTTL